MQNDIVLITGGSSGFGKATAKKFAENGAAVIITGRHRDSLEKAAAETGAEYVVADASKPADWEMLVSYVKEKYGRLDFLFNNAGGGVAIEEVAEISIEKIDKIYAVNLASVTYGCHYFAPMFKTQKSGTIINVASVCAKQAWPGWSVYAAAKWGVLGLTKGLTTELAPLGIRVTCLIPGAGATNFCNAASIHSASVPLLTPEAVAQTVYDIYTLPKTVWVEETTVWGMDQIVNPL